MSAAWLTRNPRARRDQAYGEAQRAVIDPAAVPDVANLPGGERGATPLRSLPALAERLGVGELRVKDESQRMGFGAFKALGGVFAVHQIVENAKARDKDRTAADFTFTTASSGNHGRAVALGAQSVGAHCTIFLPKFTSAEKEAAIRGLGADVIRIDGNYEDAVAACRLQAEQRGWTIVSDTSWPGYESVPRTVMRGYTALAREVLQQWPQGPTHLFVQAGVGGLAAAVIGYLWAVAPERPLSIVVEPESADCWFQSNLAGKPALSHKLVDTAMGGLACREISPITWPVLGDGTDWFMTIEEDMVLPARRLFAQHGVTSGPSGCAGLAALVRVCGDQDARQALKLDRAARVLLINSEGNLGEALPD
jgi:diaminopropionate ammonia-lyase